MNLHICVHISLTQHIGKLGVCRLPNALRSYCREGLDPPVYAVRFRRNAEDIAAFPAGRVKTLPYSVFWAFLKQTAKHQFSCLLA